MNYDIFKDSENICGVMFDIWKRTYDQFDYTINYTKNYISDKYIGKIESKEGTLNDKCNQLCTVYCDTIKRYVTLYVKEDLLIGLIAIKEYITKNITKLDSKLEYIYDERTCINRLIYFINGLEECDFKNNCIDVICKDGYSYIMDIFLWGRQLCQLEANMERYAIAEKRNVSLINMAFDTVEDETFHNYYEIYEEQGSYEKFEDYIIKDVNIQKQVERLNIMPNQILQNANKVIQKYFGFSLQSLRKFSQAIALLCFETDESMIEYIQDDVKVFTHVVFPRNIIYELADKFNITQVEIGKIIENFSINNKTALQIELSCFYFTRDVVYFGPCDMMQVFGMFEKFSLTGSYLEHFKSSVDLVNILQPCQRATSKYLCYVLTDILVSEGYKMHMEKFTYNKVQYNSACAEVENISNGKENILKNLGDCDVLFLDEYKRQVVCIEFKYFQPSITFEQLCKSDRNKFTKQVYEKIEQIHHREEALKLNIEYVVKYLGGYGKDYTVKTIIVIARPNMYVFTDEIKQRIKYEIMTMNEFNKKITAHKI